MTIRMSEEEFEKLRGWAKGQKKAEAPGALAGVKKGRAKGSSVWVRADGSPSEAGEARTLARWMRAEGIFFVRIPNEASRNPASMMVLKLTGLETDAPDYLIIDRPPLPARVTGPRSPAAPALQPAIHGIALELKAGPRAGVYPEVRDGQKAMLNRFEAAGWVALVCFGAANAILRLQELGIGKSAKNRRMK